MQELEVLPRDLQLCPNIATGIESLGQLQQGDLVYLDAQTVGVILRLARETCHVLSMHGKVVEAKPESIRNFQKNRTAIALDSQQSTIKRKDVVKVVDGSHAGQNGEIKYLYRGFAFVHSRMFPDNGGIFVCKTRHLLLRNDNKENSMNSMNSPAAGFMSPKIASPMHHTR
jgi:transcription elongation factor SPT5